jgi:ABC-type polysaccharide/polyol phosphate export permease
MAYSRLRALSVLYMRDLRIVCADLRTKTIDALIMTVAVVLVSGYVLPLLGLEAEYGAFMIMGVLVSDAFYKAQTQAYEFLADLQGPRRLIYDLTLPVPTWLIFIKSAAVYGTYAACMNLPMLPVGKLLLGSRFSFVHISWSHLLISYIIVHAFFGVMAVWQASLAERTQELDTIAMRITMPLWLVGGFQFSWCALADRYPLAGVLNLLNPMVYAYESMRGAVLGQEGYLNFYACILVLLLFSVLLMTHALLRFKRRLDFV